MCFYYERRSGGVSKKTVASTPTDTATSETGIATMKDLEDKTIGTIVWFGVSDDILVKIFSEGYQIKCKAVKSFESEASLIMALDTQKIDAAWMRDFQAKTYAKHTQKYTMIVSEADKLSAGSARMAALSSSPQAQELTKINSVIAEMKQDGTLADLRKKFVDDFDFATKYESVTMPKIEGAPTYKVSISGSMVPLDYIAVDGKPTGFSIALLAKISEKAKINFELVPVGFNNDRIELTSGKIDFIFCYTLTDATMAKDKELKYSEPYYSYDGSAILVKK